MRREKFFYNKQTLQYEKIRLSIKEKLSRIFGFTSAVVVTGFLLTLLIWKFFPSPQEELLLAEIDRLKGEISVVKGDFDLMSRALSSIQDRDRRVHRLVLEMDPVDENVWEGGVGGTDRYAELKTFRNSGDMMAQLRQKVDKLKRQMVVQSKSLDEIEEMAEGKEKMLASIPSIKPVRADKLNRGVELLSGFGYRLHPIHKIVKMHAGIDFSAPQGTPIQATGDGKVVEVDNNKSGYGLHVVIDHGYGYKTLYGHLSGVEVKVGQKIKKGHQIGEVGSTGTSTAPHCHYEVHYKGKPVNPIDYVLDGLTPKEYQELVRLSELDNQSFD
ncbi:MAG: M23 family metallopeptidase [Lewinellaceae bacterium]|nr:M23 family metallopeptidase [Saprospiraceae bacterium]MCB9336871.1 M23 family metallopeptidase [Lewinellaceae bacterium]